MSTTISFFPRCAAYGRPGGCTTVMGVTVSIQPAQIRRLTNERHLSSPPGLRNLRWWPLAFNADGFAAGVMRISDAQDPAGSPVAPPTADQSCGSPTCRAQPVWRRPVSSQPGRGAGRQSAASASDRRGAVRPGQVASAVIAGKLELGEPRGLARLLGRFMQDGQTRFRGGLSLTDVIRRLEGEAISAGAGFLDAAEAVIASQSAIVVASRSTSRCSTLGAQA